MNKVDLFKNIKQEQNSVMVKILEQDVEIRKQSLQELAEIEYVVMQILLDEDTKSYNAHLYDFIIDTRILEYFTNIDISKYELEDLYKLLNTETGKNILKEVKEHVLVKEQIQQLYNSINKQIKFTLDKIIYRNSELEQLFISANALITTISNIINDNMSAIEQQDLSEFIKKISSITDLTKDELIDKVLEHNKDIKPNRATRRSRKNKDNILEIVTENDIKE